MLPFACKDVASEPPTTVIIVEPNGTPPSSAADGAFVLEESNVEPTEGWQNREGKPTLTICFMHSFGKCQGRTGGDPYTCFQVHIKKGVLSALRTAYKLPTRTYFARLVHAQLSANFRQHLSMVAKRELKMQYLDYNINDAVPTAGLLQYEATYRTWLFDTKKTRDDLPDNIVYQCENYAVAGWCPNNAECTGIHAPLNKAQVRDSVVAAALQNLTSLAQSKASSSPMEPVSSHSATSSLRGLSHSHHGGMALVPALVEPAPGQGTSSPNTQDSYRSRVYRSMWS